MAKHKPSKQRRPARTNAKVAASPLRRWRVPLGVAALCGIHFVLAVTSVRDKSNTYDELAHLTRGFSYRLTDDFRLGPPHPPLAHYWASIPGQQMGVKLPPKLRAQEPWYTSDVWVIGRQFFYYKGLGNDALIDSLLWRGRAMITLWSVALAVLVFTWTRRLFCTTGAFVALTLYTFSPSMLAHARLVTTDLAAALFLATSLATIWWMLHRVSAASVLASAASLACLFLAKLSAVLIIPMGAVLLGLRLVRTSPLPVGVGTWQRQVTPRWQQAAVFTGVLAVWVIVVWSSIWMAYGGRYSAMIDAKPDRDRFYSNSPIPAGKTVWQHQLRGLGAGTADTLLWLRDHRVFPEAYVYSAVYARQTARGRNAFLNGTVDIEGHRWFFPYCLLAKTPLPLFGLMGLAIGAAFVRRPAAGRDAGSTPPTTRSWGQALYATAPLWVMLVVYWSASLGSKLNIGHRHIVPTYPMMFILCGAVATWLRPAADGSTLRSAARWSVAALLGLFAIASVYRYPDYLAYFNSLVGGPGQAYRHLVDSSLDWGQDLPGLARYLAQRKQAGTLPDRVYLSYFGSGGPLAVKHFEIDAVLLPARLDEADPEPVPFEPGLYAISATRLQQVYLNAGEHRWTAELEGRYQRQRAVIDAFDRDGTLPAVARDNPSAWRRTYANSQKLRLGRLCAYLRRREPDANVGHSILLYELTPDQLSAALAGPADALLD